MSPESEEELHDWYGAVIVKAQEHVSIRELVTGYCRAFHRFQAEQGYIALFETLNWADATDDFLERGPKNRGARPDWLDYLAQDERNVVRGMRHARNIVHHRWWAALGHRIVKTKDGQTHAWVWDELPSGERHGRKAKEERRAYDTALRGEPAVETLMVLRDAFWSVRRWEIKADDLDQPSYPVPVGAPVD